MRGRSGERVIHRLRTCDLRRQEEPLRFSPRVSHRFWDELDQQGVMHGTIKPVFHRSRHKGILLIYDPRTAEE